MNKKTLISLCCFFMMAFAGVSRLSAAAIESVVFNGVDSNIITLRMETPPEGKVTWYRVDFVFGTALSSNIWQPFEVTTAVTISHRMSKLGDHSYQAYHMFLSSGDPNPSASDPGWISPGPIKTSSYIHDFKRGNYSAVDETSQLNMGPMWWVKYQLFDDSFVTFRVYRSSCIDALDNKETVTDWGFPADVTGSDPEPIRTIVHKVPRSMQLKDSSWWNTEEWDCRDDFGNLVENGMYTCVIDAYSKYLGNNYEMAVYDPSDTPSLFSDPFDIYPSSVGRRGFAWLNLPVDILRLMRIQSKAVPVMDYQGQDAFTYLLTGASKVTIKVYKSDVKFVKFDGVDTVPTSPTYGEPIPSEDLSPAGSSVPVKTMSFYRAAGEWSETWDGSDNNQTFLPNGIYVYAISATNGNRIATDQHGNDRPIFGNVTITREGQPPEIAAKITSVAFEDSSKSNIIKWDPVVPISGYSTQYEVQFVPGNINTQNIWTTAVITDSPEAYHILPILGDYSYRIRHRFASASKGTTQWSNLISTPVCSNYITSASDQYGVIIDRDDTMNGNGPIWKIKYQLYDAANVTVKIYRLGDITRNAMGFPTGYSGALVRTLTNEAPRNGRAQMLSWVNVEEWDGRDTTGKLEENGIYTVSIDAYDKDGKVFDPSLSFDARIGNVTQDFAVDTLRVSESNSYTLTDYNDLKAFSYKLTIPAEVTIKIFDNAATFNKPDFTNSTTYGEPQPVPGPVATPLKTIKVYRNAGAWEELWNGAKDDGTFIANGVYKYFITAKNGVITATYSGTTTDIYQPPIGNITISRGAFPSSADDGIDSIKYDMASKSNIITLKTIEPPQSGYKTEYEVQYTSGNIYTENKWVSLGIAQQPEAVHQLQADGDYLYKVRHRFFSVDKYTDWSTFPSTPVAAPYIHDVQIAGYTQDPTNEAQLGMGPLWYIKYQTHEASFISIQIYAPGTTVTKRDSFGFPELYSNPKPIKKIVLKTPRPGEQQDSSWWNTEEWDARNDDGVLQGNGIYVVVIDAYNKDNLSFSSSDPGRISNHIGLIPADTLRIMKVQANPITDYIGANAFSYRLTGAAQVTLNVYSGGTTFSGIDKVATSATFGQPKTSASPLVTKKYYRPAGNWEETWDGYDPAGNALLDGLYTFSISAVNGSILAYDNSNDEQPIYGNMTIMRTAPPDSDTGTPGTGTTTGTGSGGIVIGTYAPGRNRAISGALTTVIVAVSGTDVIDTDKSAITVTDPIGRRISNKVLTAGKYVGMNLAPQKTPGEYDISLRLVATNGKYWNESYKLIIMPTGSFSQQIMIGPNPVKNPYNKVKIAIPTSTEVSASVKLYNLLGDLIKESDVSLSPTSVSIYEWDVSDVGNGLYFCRIEVGGDKAIKKIMVAR